MTIHFRALVPIMLLSALAFAQANPHPPVPPCSTCVVGGGSAGTLPVLAPGSAANQGILMNSTITDDGVGTISLGPIVDGNASGTINGKLGKFVGDLGGLIGWDLHIDPANAYVGVIGKVDNANGFGVAGSANSPTGVTNGVRGRSFSVDGIGVVGVGGPNGPFVAGTAIGVQGTSRVIGGIGVFGTSPVDSGFTQGVRGSVFSPDGVAGVFSNRGGGDILRGESGEFVQKFRVDGAGNLFASGSINAYSTFADVAERIDTIEPLRAGDVVEIDPSSVGRFRKARAKYSTAVAGIVSSAPAITLSNAGAIERPGSDTRPVLALVGRVPVQVNDEGGAIRVGDLLTSSSTAGVAMRCSDRLVCSGAIVGKALQPLNATSGTIEALVTLQ